MSKFIDEMKTGKNWEDALSDTYQLTPDELKTAFLSAANGH
jgi:hypothetical protein